MDAFWYVIGIAWLSWMGAWLLALPLRALHRSLHLLLSALLWPVFFVMGLLRPAPEELDWAFIVSLAVVLSALGLALTLKSLLGRRHPGTPETN